MNRAMILFVGMAMAACAPRVHEPALTCAEATAAASVVPVNPTQNAPCNRQLPTMMGPNGGYEPDGTAINWGCFVPVDDPAATTGIWMRWGHVSGNDVSVSLPMLGGSSSKPVGLARCDLSDPGSCDRATDCVGASDATGASVAVCVPRPCTP